MINDVNLLEQFLIEICKKMSHRIFYDKEKEGICFINKNLKIKILNNNNDILIVLKHNEKVEQLKIKDFEINEFMSFLSSRATYNYNFSLRVEDEDLVNKYDKLLTDAINENKKTIKVNKKNIEIYTDSSSKLFFNFNLISLYIPELGLYGKYILKPKKVENVLIKELNEKLVLFLDRIEDIEEISEKVRQYKLYLELNKDINNNNKIHKQKI